MANETCQPPSLEDYLTHTLRILKFKNESTIPFHRLPLLVQIRAIQTMGPRDWINLAMTSKRNERVVKLTRIKTESLCVEISRYACIQLPSLELNLFYELALWKEGKLEMLTKKDMRPWLKQPFGSMIENAGLLYQKIQNLFVLPNNDLEISFCTDIPGKATIQELLSNSVIKNWTDLTITGNKISSEDLKMIMDTATSRRTFNSAVEEMPLDFRHENAFKFSVQVYHDARWVQIEDLYGLRNLVRVLLSLNHFTQEQLKSYVDYWVNSEVDMFGWIQILRTESFNFGNLVDGLLGLENADLSSKMFFTLSKSSSNRRKKTMLIISYDDMREYLVLEACDVNAKYAPSTYEEENKKYENVGKILTLLHEKKELEDLLGVANEEAKMGLSAKIKDSIAELAAFKVIFIDGKVTHNLFETWPRLIA